MTHTRTRPVPAGRVRYGYGYEVQATGIPGFTRAEDEYFMTVVLEPT